jgi:hypothetical protein
MSFISFNQSGTILPHEGDHPLSAHQPRTQERKKAVQGTADDREVFRAASAYFEIKKYDTPFAVRSILINHDFGWIENQGIESYHLIEKKKYGYSYEKVNRAFDHSWAYDKTSCDSIGQGGCHEGTIYQRGRV